MDQLDKTLRDACGESTDTSNSRGEGALPDKPLYRLSLKNQATALNVGTVGRNSQFAQHFFRTPRGCLARRQAYEEGRPGLVFGLREEFQLFDQRTEIIGLASAFAR